MLTLIQINVNINESEIIDAPINKIWSIISDFNALPEWHPAILDSFIENGKTNGAIGCVRNFNLNNNGGNIREELMLLDDEKFILKYKILNCPMPLSNYEAILKLEPLDSRTKIIWECHFDCHQVNKDHLQKTIAYNIFRGGFDALRKLGNLSYF